jgi:hypothetical protein
MRYLSTNAATITTVRKEGYYPSEAVAKKLARRFCWVTENDNSQSILSVVHCLSSGIPPDIELSTEVVEGFEDACEYNAFRNELFGRGVPYINPSRIDFYQWESSRRTYKLAFANEWDRRSSESASKHYPRSIRGEAMRALTPEELANLAVGVFYGVRLLVNSWMPSERRALCELSEWWGAEKGSAEYEAKAYVLANLNIGRTLVIVSK